MAFCDNCGIFNAEPSEICTNCGRAFHISQDTLEISNYISPKVLNTGMLLGLLSIIIGFILSLLPLVELLQHGRVSSTLTALLALGFALVGLQIFLTCLSGNIYLNDFFIQRYYQGNQRLSILRIVIINSKDRFPIYLLVFSLFSFILMLFFGLQPVARFLNTGKSSYFMSADLGFGFGITGILFLTHSFIIYLITRQTPPTK